ncbi:MAG: Nramp family divalent metal transporter [bacterium]
MKKNFIYDFLIKTHKHSKSAREFLKYLGPGILVTVGFIDPGNWAANLAAGSKFGYNILWVITLSTIMLILLQHNAARLGIASGLCLSEAANKYLKPIWARSILVTAILASISTALAEIMGAAIGFDMLFKIPIKIGAVIAFLLILLLLFTNSYKKLEKLIIGFVSIIGFCFLIELSLVHIHWAKAAIGWTVPSFPHGSIFLIMSVLGAVIMPHNMFLHSEVIQSRQFNLEEEAVIKKQLKFEFLDTLFSMIIGWAINSAMILVAIAVFYNRHMVVTDLKQAELLLEPLLSSKAAFIFAVALLFSGISSSITAGMAGGSIFSGLFNEPYNIKDSHSIMGVLITSLFAVLIIFFVSNPFNALVYSQIALSIQLPLTIFLQIKLTSSKKVMGKYANSKLTSITLWVTGIIVALLNIIMFVSFFIK